MFGGVGLYEHFGAAKVFDDAGADMKCFFIGFWSFESISDNILFDFVIYFQKGVIRTVIIMFIRNDQPLITAITRYLSDQFLCIFLRNYFIVLTVNKNCWNLAPRRTIQEVQRKRIKRVVLHTLLQ